MWEGGERVARERRERGATWAGLVTCLAEVCEEAAVDAAARHGRHAMVFQQRHLQFRARRRWGENTPTHVRIRRPLHHQQQHHEGGRYLLRSQAVDRVAEPAAAVLVGPPCVDASVPPHGASEPEAAGDGGDGDAGEGDHTARLVQGGGGAVAETPEGPLRHTRYMYM